MAHGLMRRVGNRLMAMGLGVVCGLGIVMVLGEWYERLHVNAGIAEPPGSGAILTGGDERLACVNRVIRLSSLPGIYYELQPKLDVDCWGVRLRTNSLGIRHDEEISRRKPPATYRIACLGDSFTFGWGLPRGEAYPAVLERMLNESAEREVQVEVHNWGVVGYNAAQEVSTYLYKAAKFDYDLIVLGMVANDADPPPSKRWYNRKGVQSAFLDQLIVNFSDGVGCVKLALRALKREADTRRTGVVVVLHYADVELGRDNQISLYEKLKPTIAEFGFGLVDMLPVYESYLHQAGERDSRCLWVATRPVEDPHPNRLACQLIAGAIRAYLCEHVPPFNSVGSYQTNAQTP